MSLTVSVEVPPSDREVLASWVRSPSIRAELARRARIVLLAADGLSTSEIARRAGVSQPTVLSWKRRYAVEGIGGLEDRPHPGKPRTTDDVAAIEMSPRPCKRCGARRGEHCRSPKGASTAAPSRAGVHACRREAAIRDGYLPA
jgi:transposase-like protein